MKITRYFENVVVEIADNVVADVEAGGVQVGIETEHASKIFDLSRLDLSDIYLLNSLTLTGEPRAREAAY